MAELDRERLVESLRCKGHDTAALAGLVTDELRTLDAKKTPSTLVVRYGRMKQIGEFPYSGDMTPGCGSRLVVRTQRGTEIGEMLTSTCPNSGCGSSVSRKEMLEYIENSGGRQYPFSTDGLVLRIATKEDMDTQSRLEQSCHGLKMTARSVSESMKLAMKIVEAEPILGGERLTIFYTSEDRIDFRELVRELGSVFGMRVDMRQVGARDEARLTADYEKCGQYCCCKNFLKVLKPISMKSAKVQKATLDPVKISGRCGRLMCCLRYEDETYTALSKRLPKRKTLVGTPDGDGIVISTQILTQLVLVRFDDAGDDQAYPIEEIGKPGERPDSSGPAREVKVQRPAPARPAARVAGGPSAKPERGSRRGPAGGAESAVGATEGERGRGPGGAEPSAIEAGGDGVKKKKKRRRRKRKSAGGSGEAGASDGQVTEGGVAGPGESENASSDNGGGGAGPADGNGAPDGKKRRRRRRRRKPGSDGTGGEGNRGEGSGGGEPGDGGGSA